MSKTFNISGKELFAALAAVAPAFERRNAIPILGMARFTSDLGGLSVSVTNLDSVFTYTIKGGFPIFDVCVDFYTLHAFVKAQKAGDVLLTIDVTDGFVIKGFQYATSEGIKFLTLPAADWPVFKDYGYGKDYDFDPGLINKVKAAVSTEETRYYLNGVFFCTRSVGQIDQFLHMVATDGHRLIMWESDTAYAGPDVIIPRGFCEALSRLQPGVLATCEQAVRFVSGPLVACSKIIDGKFPDYERVVPKPDVAPQWRASIPRQDLFKAIAVLNTLCPHKANSTKLTFKDQGLVVERSDGNGNKFAAEVKPCQHDIEPSPEFDVGFNARYLADCLKSFSGNELTFRFTDKSSPCLVTDDRLTYVLMPLRY